MILLIDNYLNRISFHNLFYIFMIGFMKKEDIIKSRY